MVEVTVFLETEIYPTESDDKVKVAVKNVLDNAEITIKPALKGNTLTAVANGQESLIKLRNLLRNDRIRDAARRLLLKSMKPNQVSFYLNKQVAYAGHISFSEETAESPLGPLRINIETDNPQLLIEWLCEKTAK